MERANQKLKSLWELWNEKHGERARPARHGLAVNALTPWLGNLALIELKNANGPSFRLCGTNLHGRFGGEGNGCQIEALKDGIAASLHNAARRLPETVEPIQTKHKVEKTEDRSSSR